MESFEKIDQKIKLWSSKLIDLTKRNRLLNYKEYKRSTLKLEMSAEELWQKLVDDESELRFDAKLTQNEQKRLGVLERKTQEENNASEEEIEEHKSLIALREKRRSQAIILETIRKNNRTANDEYGFNISFAALGFLHWHEDEHSKEEIVSPIVLIPILVERKSISDPYTIALNENEEIKINPIIIKKLFADFDIKLNEEINFENIWKENLIAEIFDPIKKLIQNYSSWKIDINKIRVGTFNFQNLVIARDLENNKELIKEHNFCRALARENYDEEYVMFDQEDYDPEKRKSFESFQILDADSSQQIAIERAIAGKSFVIQGPPGTGKSQTITNIIAELLQRGKTILFVSEKQAALNIVYDKLAKFGLDNFVVKLHEVKKEAGYKIRAQLSKLLSIANSEIYAGSNYNDHVRLDEIRARLMTYADELHNIISPFGENAYFLLGELAPHSAARDLLFMINTNVTRGDYEEYKLAVEKYANSFSRSSSQFENCLWKHYKKDITFLTEAELKEFINEAEEKYKNYTEILRKITDEFLSKNTAESDISPTLKKLIAAAQEKPRAANYYYYNLDRGARLRLKEDILCIHDYYKKASDLNKEERKIERDMKDFKANLSDKFNEEFFMIENPKELLNKFSAEYNTVFRTLNMEYFGLMCLLLSRSKKKNEKITYDEAKEYLEILVDFHKKTEEKKRLAFEIELIQNETRDLIKKFNTKSGALITHILDKNIENIKDKICESVDYLEKYECLFGSETNCKKEAINNLFSDRYDADKLLTIVKLEEDYEKEHKIVSEILARAGELFDEFSRISDISKLFELDFEIIYRYRDYKSAKAKLLNLGLENFLEKIESAPYPKNEILGIFVKRFCMLLLDRNYKNYYDRNAHDLDVEKFKNLDKTIIGHNAIRIKDSLKKAIAKELRLSDAREVSVLNRELGKRKRSMPTRLLIKNLPTLLPNLIRCAMMSPLTVSAYFGTNPKWKFDAVIFDEASQVRPEYAVSSIMRGKQIIIAGDSKQMPPSNFFNKISEEDEIEEEEIEDNADLESILDEAKTILPSARLLWHYRSKDESLISFSNNKFYDNELVTFPNNDMDRKSAIIFKRIENGIWESKSGNEVEAEEVANMVFEHIVSNPQKSLGVIAFGKVQADLIQRKIDEKRESSPYHEWFFGEDKNEPFFVKNLENVQGDERDIVILSVGYGKSPKGNFYMRFGPLTKEGGERRLNVAITRAKYLMIVACSFTAKDMKIDEKTAVNRILLRDFIDYAENGAKIPAKLNYEDRLYFNSFFEENVYSFLQEKGFKVHTQVGQSGFKIDLAIEHPEIKDRYLIAIECDGASYNRTKTARDRDRLRQEILESYGWKFHRVWSANWIYDNKREKELLLNAIEKAIMDYDGKEKYLFNF
jgi:very-short-patch-repair endonuclease/flagellar biosynthesis GTPase FlhF